MTTIDTGTCADTTEEFAVRMVEAIDSASLAILLSIGHQTKLFDTLAELPPATTAQIADAAGLNERYVRERLCGVGGALPRRRAAPTPPGSTSATCASGLAVWSPTESSSTTQRRRHIRYRSTARRCLPAPPGRTTSRGSRSSSHSSVKWNRRSSAASTTAVDCPTATIPGSTS